MSIHKKISNIARIEKTDESVSNMREGRKLLFFMKTKKLRRSETMIAVRWE